MAARGTVAKENVVKKLKEAFGNDFICEYDKKIFLWANDGGERVQIAISMTCPKTNIEVDKNASSGGDWDFSDNPTDSGVVAIASAAPAEITQEEQDNIAALLEQLGL